MRASRWLKQALARGLRSQISEFWAVVRYQTYRSWFYNGSSRLVFARQKPRLTEIQSRIVKDLGNQGIAFASFDELFDDSEQWTSLYRAADEFINSEAVQLGIEKYRTDFEAAKWKEYLIRLNGKPAIATLTNPWLRFGVTSQIINIVNCYLGMWSKLLNFDLWYTIALNEERGRTGSQQWHRDPEDERMVKVFLYFTDVDESAGPLQYISGSFPGGPYGHLWHKRGPIGQPRPSEKELESEISSSHWVTSTGNSGTIIFCNTRGLHRGGFATGRPRVCANWTFVTPASVYPRQFRLDTTGEELELSESARFAIT